jgi:hypothetical protein
MKTKLLTLALATSIYTYAQTAVPKPDHVVILMMENYGYNDIVGNSNAPHINALISDPHTALFTQSFALTHPSQPNYVMLFSGSYQGVNGDVISSNTPWSTCNLGASLISNGYTFAGYSESLSSVGSLATTAGGTSGYARKHAPWTNWQGTGTNRLPSSVGQPFTSFPTTTSTFSTLPTVSFVVPNLGDDMHNPTSGTNYTVTAISNGDTWVYNNITNYITWAKTHNSLLILTFDEDDGGSLPNQITTMFIGQMVQGGSYSNAITHYNVLHTLEEMYGLPYCDSSAYATSITNVWNSSTTGIEQVKSNDHVTIYPNPNNGSFVVESSNTIKQTIQLYDVNGKMVLSQALNGKTTIDGSNLNEGVYNLSTISSEGVVNKRIVIVR